MSQSLPTRVPLNLLPWHRLFCCCRAACVLPCPDLAPASQELLVSYGPTLLRLELAAVVGLVSENRIPDIAGTLLQIMLATSQAGVQWLQEAVAAIPEACATMMDKQSFVQRVGQACNVNAANPPEMEQSVW